MTGLEATLPLMQESGWSSRWKIVFTRGAWRSWSTSRLRSKETGGRVTPRVCKETKINMTNTDTCTKGRFAWRARRKTSGATLYKHRTSFYILKPHTAEHLYNTCTQYENVIYTVRLDVILLDSVKINKHKVEVIIWLQVTVLASNYLMNRWLLYEHAMLHEYWRQYSNSNYILGQAICWL